MKLFNLIATGLIIVALLVELTISVAKKDYHEMSSGLEKRISFLPDANEGKYTHGVKMPWEVMETNADSVHDTELLWQPPVTKFLLGDYTMYAVSRQLNYWALILSGGVIIATILVFYKRRVAK